MIIRAAAVEFWLIVFWVAVGHFGSVHCITFVRTVQTSLAEACSRASRVTGDGRAVGPECKLLRRIQLVISIFNLFTSGMIFANKLLDNIGAVAGFYFFVRLIFIHPMVSLLFLLFMLDSVGLIGLQCGIMHL